MPAKPRPAQPLVLAAFLAVAQIVMVLGLSVAWPGPAAAQFSDDRFPMLEQRRRSRPPPPPSQPQFTNPFQSLFGGFQSNSQRSRDWQSYPEANRPPPPPADFSKAPPPRKPEGTPENHILVLGDSMADWLAYGLEDVLSDAPEFGVSRKIRTYSGLIRYEAKGDVDGPRAVREILAAERPNFIVMMLGVNDRQPLRERIAVRTAPAQQKPDPARPNQPAQPARSEQPKPDAGRTDQAASPEEAAKPDAAGGEAPADAPEQPSIAAVEPQQSVARGAAHEFRTEKWEELYGRLIDETIAVLKSKNVPVFWVGIPSVRGTRSTSDANYLNGIFRSHAEKAGIVFIDIWDGFVDEAGRFTVQGPDFEGQIRRLRAADGVHFTKAGARKLGHYVERELRRTIAARSIPVALPAEPELAAPPPTAEKRPDGPPPRPLAGPVVPLGALGAASDQLAGGAGGRGQVENAEAVRVLVRGEAAGGATGRADDFAWPRQASVSPNDILPAPDTSQPPRAGRPVAATPAIPARSGSPAAAPAAQPGQKTPADAERRAKPRPRPQQAQAPQQQQQQQQPGGFRLFTPGGDPRSAPRPPQPIGPSAQRPSWNPFGGGF